MLELLYPVVQGYDSVAIRADVELGGTDQKFNLLLGRDIQRPLRVIPEQAAVDDADPARGPTACSRMSKSLGNYIGGDRLARGDLRQDPCRCPMRRSTSTSGSCSTRGPRPAARAPCSQSAPSRADRSGVLDDSEQAAAAEAHFNRVVVDQQEPEEIADAAVHAVDGSVHAPCGRRAGVRHLPRAG